ncbi:hypothetical protein Strop_2317 [Salinispora tropica CNB-440]|uniref:Resolvase/invertase-type recombinase catalytic domain-containing protein n=1 Tax=Salinispora tropica (strain ATCC BAA-916 / DSM 44818 / JCM 13857 / NBRC 105044 / CNB-440) TaxID=369723 RepID=A4X7B5_SALTO|nr:hypothetical protein Strop_2317 [Salinispora tropica CNB-440]
MHRPTTRHPYMNSDDWLLCGSPQLRESRAYMGAGSTPSPCPAASRPSSTGVRQARPPPRTRQGAPGRPPAGEQLVVTKLDRLIRFLEHLIDLPAQLQQRGVDAAIRRPRRLRRIFFSVRGR